MTRFTQLLGISLLSAMAFAEPQKMPKADRERQPGTLRISGAADSDQVLLDGELIGNGKRVAQFGNKLLVNPGQYTITIVSSSNGQACDSTVDVPENGVAVARCEGAQPVYDRLVD